MRTQVNKWDLAKISNIYSCKGTVKKVRHRWKKIHIPIKRDELKYNSILSKKSQWKKSEKHLYRHFIK